MQLPLNALADMDDAVALQAKLSDVKGRVLRLFEDWLSNDGPLSDELSDRMEWAISGQYPICHRSKSKSFYCLQSYCSCS